jgi:hypothetical protein
VEVNRLYVDCVRLSFAIIFAGLSFVRRSFVSLRSTSNPLTNLDLLQLKVKPIFGLVHAEVRGAMLVLFAGFDVCSVGEVPTLYFGEYSHGIKIDVLFNPIAATHQ